MPPRAQKKRPRSIHDELDDILLKQRRRERKSNADRFLAMRGAGKTYYKVDGDRRFWWTREQLEERRGEFESIEEAQIMYDELGDGHDYFEKRYLASWPTASQEEIETLLKNTKKTISIHCV